MKIIAGKYKGIALKTPKSLHTRPTTSRLRETLFNILQNRIEGATFLDLFAGSGLIGFEALSRGAKRVTFIDNDRESIHAIRLNGEKLSASGQIDIVRSDALKAVERLCSEKKQFSIIYIDPPYSQRGEANPLSKVLLQIVDKNALLAEGGLLFIEEGHTIDVAGLTTLTLDRTLKSGQATLHQFSSNSCP